MAPLSKLWCQVCGEVAPGQFQPMTWWACSSACVTKFGQEEAMKVMEQKVRLRWRRKYGAKHGWHP